MKRESTLTKIGEALSVVPEMASWFSSKYFGTPRRPALYYVVPNKNWSTDWDGFYITSEIQRQFGWSAQITAKPHLLAGQILHYGELGAFLASLRYGLERRNTIIATIFHGDRDTRFPELARSVERFIENAHLATRIVTACRIMEERLITWGIPEGKVVRIPLGVDLNTFKPVTPQQRSALRRSLGIKEDSVCIGSFQKDGVGWEDGLIPKPVKGPDVFLEVIERLHKHFKLTILLTGPARGYVKRGLDSLSVPYRHEILEDYPAIARLYPALDAYLVTSREEGGPKAALESLACGVPLVSTRVGLVPEVIEHGRNGLLADVEDGDTLAELVARVIQEQDLRQRLTTQGVQDIIAYDWGQIAARYYRELYKPVLEEMQLPHD